MSDERGNLIAELEVIEQKNNSAGVVKLIRRGSFSSAKNMLSDPTVSLYEPEFLRSYAFDEALKADDPSHAQMFSSGSEDDIERLFDAHCDQGAYRRATDMLSEDSVSGLLAMKFFRLLMSVDQHELALKALESAHSLDPSNIAEAFNSYMRVKKPHFCFRTLELGDGKIDHGKINQESLKTLFDVIAEGERSSLADTVFDALEIKDQESIVKYFNVAGEWDYYKKTPQLFKNHDLDDSAYVEWMRIALKDKTIEYKSNEFDEAVREIFSNKKNLLTSILDSYFPRKLEYVRRILKGVNDPSYLASDFAKKIFGSVFGKNDTLQPAKGVNITFYAELLRHIESSEDRHKGGVRLYIACRVGKQSDNLYVREAARIAATHVDIDPLILFK